MRIAYLDCFAGIAGDMLLGALVDAGVPRTVLESATAAVGLGATLRFETVDRSGISATKVQVFEGSYPVDAEPIDTPEASPFLQRAPGHAHPHRSIAPIAEIAEDTAPEVHGRSLTDIRQLIEASSIAAEVKSLALQTFELLGRSEAKIHNVPLDSIHFHEVGAVDAIVDVVAACAGIVHLAIDRWHCSPINVGGGTVRCAHGVFPVPAPATADLLRGLPTYSAHVQKELVTPTGAAILRALSPSFGPQPAMAIRHIGYGAGTRNPPGFPNVVRLSIGDAQTPQEQETVTVLETALDDATPQLLAYVAEQALRMGALDVMLTPVLMKKGRPGTLLTVLAKPSDAHAFEQLLLQETTTLGVRIRQDRRVSLHRAHVAVSTPFGSIRVKTGARNGEVLNAQPEFEDCRRAAEASDTPLKTVQAAAAAAYLGAQEPAAHEPLRATKETT